MSIDGVNPVQLDLVPGFFAAVEANDVELAKQLLKKDPRIALVHYEGRTALMLAAFHQQADMSHALLPFSDTDAVSADQGLTALHCAALAWSVAGLRALIADSDPDQPNSEGQSAVMLAAANGFAEGVRFLAPFSNLALKDENGLDAVALAKSNKFTSGHMSELVVALLREEMARQERREIAQAIAPVAEGAGGVEGCGGAGKGVDSSADGSASRPSGERAPARAPRAL